MSDLKSVDEIEAFNRRAKRFFAERGMHMPHDLVVCRNRDADEAGDYRVMQHCEAVNDPQWEITDMDPAEFLRD